ncbi:unnamed protein product [Heligmosomoides polygyrus]|uniref:Ankyrin-2-like n=1 Tax=Heligmosomoides polygyrus TaxID=6339 RepID=A0A183GM60_HELPZ|nr:unnamed protein product [Heligmosomoides polygyrus]
MNREREGTDRIKGHMEGNFRLVETKEDFQVTGPEDIPKDLTKEDSSQDLVLVEVAQVGTDLATTADTRLKETGRTEDFLKDLIKEGTHLNLGPMARAKEDSIQDLVLVVVVRVGTDLATMADTRLKETGRTEDFLKDPTMEHTRLDLALTEETDLETTVDIRTSEDILMVPMDMAKCSLKFLTDSPTGGSEAVMFTTP